MKRYSLTLSNSIKDALFEHAKSIAPVESCGYLAGDNDTVTEFIPMTNVDNSPEHFSFDPKEQFQAVKAARKNGQKLIAVYHSHPETAARLSDEDIRLFNDSEPVYIIVSLKDKQPDIKGFKIFKEDENTVEIVSVRLIVNE